MNTYEKPPLSKPDKKAAITAWAEEDRPREKMLLKGKAALSDADLSGRREAERGRSPAGGVSEIGRAHV